MKSFVALSAFVATLGAANPLVERACNANNCARAVTGTSGGTAAVSSHFADCTSFFRTTLVPPTSTVTSTITPPPVTTTVTSFQITSVFTTVSTTIFIGQKRAAAATGTTTTITPTAVPGYAGSCSGTAGYSSACSCFGAPHATVVQPVPLAVTTVTAAPSTVTVTSVVPVTTEIVVTATATNGPGPRPTCGSVVQGNGGCNCGYTVSCYQRFNGTNLITTQTGISEIACIDLCDHYNNCMDADYNRRTGLCHIYRAVQDAGTVPVRDDDYFRYVQGSCGESTGQGCIVA